MPEWLLRGETYALGCALLWACAVVMFRRSTETTGPIALNLFKNAVALVLFVATMLLLGVPFFPAEASLEHWGVLLASGALGIGLADSLFFASLRRLGAGRQAIVDCAYSPFVLACSWLYLGEAISVLLFVAVGMMVVAILIGTYDPRAPARRDLWTGVAYGVCAVGLMAFGIVFAKPVLEVSEVWWATTARLVGGQLCLCLFAVSRKQRAEIAGIFRPSWRWRVLLPASVIGTYLTLWLWIMGFKHTEKATMAGLLNQSSTIFILVLATLFLKEPLTRRKVAAIVLGFAGVVVALTSPGFESLLLE